MSFYSLFTVPEPWKDRETTRIFFSEPWKCRKIVKRPFLQNFLYCKPPCTSRAIPLFLLIMKGIKTHLGAKESCPFLPIIFPLYGHKTQSKHTRVFCLITQDFEAKPVCVRTNTRSSCGQEVFLHLIYMVTFYRVNNLKATLHFLSLLGFQSFHRLGKKIFLQFNI